MPKIFELKEKDWDVAYCKELQLGLEKGAYSSYSLIHNMAILVGKLTRKPKRKKSATKKKK